MEPQTFSFTVTLDHEVYVSLRDESRNREGTKKAVPSRTARQLIGERLSQLEKKKKLQEKKMESAETEPLKVEPIEGIEGTTSTRLNTRS